MADLGLISDTRTRQALAGLREVPLNFDPAAIRRGSEVNGWHYDERLQPLQDEAPGAPEPDGPWEMARRLMRGYEFADPSIVRAYYDPKTPLERRVMLLEVRFAGLRIRVGCRVEEVYELKEQVDGSEARIWGWSYQTLQGHFEQGEMHWQVLKWPETGRIAFRIRAWSRRARDANLFIRLGFSLFGRREQLRFYESTCKRMERLTAEARGEGPRGDAVREVAERATARSVGDADEVHDELARNVDLERPEDR